MNHSDLQALANSFAGSSDGTYHLFPIGRPARTIPWEAVRAYVAGRGGCPCEPGTSTAWEQYGAHLRAEVADTGTAPDHSQEADYGPRGRLMGRETVGAWPTVRHLLASRGFEAAKPSPRKTMILTKAGEFFHAEIAWLPQTSPSGDRLFQISFYHH